jgi:ubiquinol-cytochrome c reductase cytochrome c subunit
MARYVLSSGVFLVAGLFVNGLSAAGQTRAPSQAVSPQSGNAEKGRQLFMKYGCYECHGTEGQGSTGTGPRLGPNPLPLAGLTKYIRQPNLQMPPYTAKVLSDEDAAHIHAFLRARPRPPGIETLDILK